MPDNARQWLHDAYKLVCKLETSFRLGSYAWFIVRAPAVIGPRTLPLTLISRVSRKRYFEANGNVCFISSTEYFLPLVFTGNISWRKRCSMEMFEDGELCQFTRARKLSSWLLARDYNSQTSSIHRVTGVPHSSRNTFTEPFRTISRKCSSLVSSIRKDELVQFVAARIEWIPVSRNVYFVF